jgi:hypothetical protein
MTDDFEYKVAYKAATPTGLGVRMLAAASVAAAYPGVPEGAGDDARSELLTRVRTASSRLSNAD